MEEKLQKVQAVDQAEEMVRGTLALTKKNGRAALHQKLIVD